jgi:signal transduction histidine kinase
VVVNLLSNAAKYRPPGGRVWLTVLREAQDEPGEGSEALIRVKDSGIGLEAELLPHLFELFSQGARTLDRPQSGLGIGLALVEMHGGAVTIQSEGPSQGSEFIVRLPTVEACGRTAGDACGELSPVSGTTTAGGTGG